MCVLWYVHLCVVCAFVHVYVRMCVCVCVCTVGVRAVSALSDGVCGPEVRCKDS